MLNNLKLTIFQPHLVRCVQSFTRNISPLSKETNESRLIGTVVAVPQLYRNSLNFLMKTYDDKQFYEVHRVTMPESLVEKAPSIVVGQNLYILGKLRLKRFKKDDGRIASEFEIRAHQIYECDIDGKTRSGTSEIDNIRKREKIITVFNSNMNEIQIFGQISFEVVNKVKFSCFHLASNYYSNQEQHVDFIPIFVYDEELRHYVRNHLKRLDRVRIEGISKSNPKTDDKGKTRMMGFVQAHSIRKMLPLHAVDD